MPVVIASFASKQYAYCNIRQILYSFGVESCLNRRTAERTAHPHFVPRNCHPGRLSRLLSLAEFILRYGGR